MTGEQDSSAREMMANYLALARKAARFWPRAGLIFTLVFAGGLAWVIHLPRMYKSEASATVFDIRANNDNGMGSDEAQAALRARLDQVYGSRANLGRIVDDMNLYPWLHGRTSHLKVIGAFQDALTYTAAGRDAFHLEFVYQNPHIAQRVIQRLLRLYTDERRAASQVQVRNELESAQTALSGLETVLSEQEDRLDRFERANHEMVEQVRLQRLGQTIPRANAAAVAALVAPEQMTALPGDTDRTRRLRIRLSALQSRFASLQRAMVAPAPAPAPAVPAEESEHVQTLRHTVAELRDRLTRLRTTYTDEYPDVQVAIRRLSEAEHDLNAALAAERSRNRSPAPVGGESPAEVRAQIESVTREIDETRASLAASVRDDRARAASEAHAAAPAPASAPATTNANHAEPRVRTERDVQHHANSRRVSTPVVAAATGAATNPEPSGNTESASNTNPADRRLDSLVEVEATWDRLMAELVATRTRYQQLLARKFELEAQLQTVNTTGADVLRVIDPPTLPAEPEPPGRTKLAAIVLALALALSLGVAGLSGYLDSRVYAPADLRRWAELPDLAPIPDLRDFRPTVSTRRGDAPPADAQT